ncbi:G-protein coupled receptor daf-37 [Lamellibrachia satsuma]|nr:G-protein coupled receptor daf-37 [Lamellibrachia satsuma]
MIVCVNVTGTEAAKYNVTTDCALFDFFIYTVASGSLCAFGLVGNAISFSVLWRDGGGGGGATSFLLRAMAIADSLVLVAAVPLYVISPIPQLTGALRSYIDFYYAAMPYLWPCYLIPYTGTIFLTVLVSLQRYFAVCRPYSSVGSCTKAQMRMHVAAIVVFAVVYNIPRFFEYTKVEYCVGQNQSRYAFDINAFGSNQIYRILYTNILYVVVMHGGPLLCLGFLNVKLIKALKERQRKRTEMGKGGYQQDITFVLIGVICVFMFCQTPTMVDHLLWTFVDDSQRVCGHWHYYYTAVGDLLGILNSSLNFVVYVLASRRFRQNLASSCSLNKPVALRMDDRSLVNAG